MTFVAMKFFQCRGVFLRDFHIQLKCKCQINLFHSILTGFEFSEFEPSALVQRQGGPCAVIAPVQAFLLKTILSETSSQDFSSVSAPFISFCVATDLPTAEMCHRNYTFERVGSLGYLICCCVSADICIFL